MTKKNFVIMVVAFIAGVIITIGAQNQYYEEQIEELNAQLESSETRYEDLFEYSETLFGSFFDYNEKIYDELNDLAEDYAFDLEDAGIGTPYMDNDFDDYDEMIDSYFEIVEPFADIIINKCEFD